MPYNIEILKKICPASEALGEKTAYSTDSSTIKGEALAVVWPSNYEQLKMLLKYASREEIPIVPRGGGTGLVGGAVPQKGIVVDLSRLNKVKKLYLNEKAVVVQAGVVLDKLNASIAEYNLEFPINPSSHSSCTIGGMLATNASDSKHSTGRWIKNWVKDITFLDGTGRIFTLEKNEAKSFIGTEGCCGVIIEATVNLVAKKNYSTDLFKFSELSSVLSKIKELKEDKMVVVMEYINSVASQIVGLGNHEHLLVKYSDSKKGSIEPSEADKLWHDYENLYSILVENGYLRGEDVLFENDAGKFVDWLNKQGFPCYGGLAAGSVHPHLQNLGQVDRIAKVVAELKGSMVGQYGVGLLRRKYAPFVTVHTVKELKVKYDPKNIMNKGKVI